MKRPTTFHSVVIEEILGQHSLSSSKDVDYFYRRFVKEGESFATITLPTFAAAIEAGLEAGSLSRSDFPAFKSRGRSGPLPGFLQGLVRLIFDDNGVLRSDANADAIYGIRQICYWSKKPKASCSPARLRGALRQFIQTEEELANLEIRQDILLDQVSGILYGGDIFSDIDSEILTCRHGPGATAERLSINGRKTIDTWSERLNDVMPVEDHALLNYGDYDRLSSVHLHSLTEEPPVRVVFVPKTMKTPRVIAIEPSYVQYAQQAVMDYLVFKLETHSLTVKSVHFTDQSVNKRGAEHASKTRAFATMDLSEASDRVSMALVETIFARSPLLPFIMGTRTMHATLDNGKTSFLLRKFASMGSANCFPVEAMVFYALIQRALHEHYQRPVTSRSIREFSSLIDVYGDDLIVPSETRGIVTRILHTYGLKVNIKKSFSAGSFRESCGGDFFAGYDVTPVYLRYPIPDPGRPCDASVIVSLVETSNLLYKRGLWTSAQTLRDHIEKLVGKKIPRTYIPGEGLTFFSYRHITACKYSKEMQTYVQKRITLEPVRIKDEACQYGFLIEALRPTGYRSRLDRRPKSIFPVAGFASDTSSSVKRGVFKTKHRWIPATLGRREI